MSHKQWYAMRDRLQKSGKWRGRGPGHRVPSREEGEPPSKASRLDDGAPVDTPDGADGDPDMPALEDPPTVEGMICLFYFSG